MSTNIPVTIWSPANGTTEYTTGSALQLGDPATVANVIVDPQAATNLITDTGITATDEPATVWIEDDSR